MHKLKISISSFLLLPSLTLNFISRCKRYVKERIWMWLIHLLFTMGPSPLKKKTISDYISHHNKSPAQHRVVAVSLQTVCTKSLEQNNMWLSRYPFQNVQTLARISFIHNGFTVVYSWLVFVSKKFELIFFFLLHQTSSYENCFSGAGVL